MTRPDSKRLGEQLLAETRRWPAAWQGDASDLPLGRALVQAMLPFLRDLVASGASVTTLRRHFGNAWVLGGDIVRKASLDLGARRTSAFDRLLEAVDDEGGPLIGGFLGEREQDDFDSTCRRLSRFLRGGTARAASGPTPARRAARSRGPCRRR